MLWGSGIGRASSCPPSPAFASASLACLIGPREGGEVVFEIADNRLWDGDGALAGVGLRGPDDE